MAKLKETAEWNPGPEAEKWADPELAGVRAENLGRGLGRIAGIALASGADHLDIFPDNGGVKITYPLSTEPVPGSAAETAEEITESCGATVTFSTTPGPEDETPWVEAKWTIAPTDWAVRDFDRLMGKAADRIRRYRTRLTVNGRRWGGRKYEAAAREVIGGDEYILAVAADRRGEAPLEGIRGIFVHGWNIDDGTASVPGRDGGSGIPTTAGVRVLINPGSPLAGPRRPYDAEYAAGIEKIKAAARGFLIRRVQVDGLIGSGPKQLTVGWGAYRRLRAWGAEIEADPGRLNKWEPEARRSAGRRPALALDAPGLVIVEDGVLRGNEEQTLFRALAKAEQVHARGTEGVPAPPSAAEAAPELAGYPAYDRLPRVKELRMMEIHARRTDDAACYEAGEEWHRDGLKASARRREEAEPGSVMYEIRILTTDGKMASVPADVVLPVPGGRRGRRHKDHTDIDVRRSEPLYGAMVDHARFDGGAETLRDMLIAAYDPELTGRIFRGNEINEEKAAEALAVRRAEINLLGKIEGDLYGAPAAAAARLTEVVRRFAAREVPDGATAVVRIDRSRGGAEVEVSINGGEETD